MFISNIKTEPIPERVYALYQLVKKHARISKEELLELMEPSSLGNSTRYLDSYLGVAEELNLVKIEGSSITYNNELEYFDTIQKFRKYVNSILVSKYSDGPFYRVTNKVFKLSRDILKYTSVSEIGRIFNFSEDRLMLGWRFWSSFLGFGILNAHENDNTAFISNCYQFLEDILPYTGLEKNVKYTVSEFVNALLPVAGIIFSDEINEHKLNFGVSNALRILHDRNILKLEFFNDQKDEWLLDKLEIHPISERITHISILEMEEL